MNILLHRDRVKIALVSLGADKFNLSVPETNILPLIIDDDEEIRGVVYGRYNHVTENIVGRGILVITDKRLMLVDKKPLFVKCEELAFSTITGISYGRVWFSGTITLRTRFGTIKIRTLNQNCARNFVHAVEQIIFANEIQGTKSMS